jgi:hypothetical protein
MGMRVQQISIFLENKSGRLAKVTQTLGDSKVNIRALSIADTSDFGVLRLIVSDPEVALAALKGAGFTVSVTDVIAVEVPDYPGGLSGILTLLDGQGINVEYMYAFVGKSADRAVVVFRVEDIDKAVENLKAAGVGLLRGQDVYSV